MHIRLGRGILAVRRTLVAFLTASLVSLMTISCSQPEKKLDTGPAEQLGRQIDKGILGAVAEAKEMRNTLGENLEQLDTALQETMQNDQDEYTSGPPLERSTTRQGVNHFAHGPVLLSILRKTFSQSELADLGQRLLRSACHDRRRMQVL